MLITGGLGFIGTNLVDHLIKKNKFDITILDPVDVGKTLFPSKLCSQVRVIRGDVTNKHFVAKQVQDKQIVMHLGAQTHTGKATVRPYPTIFSNIMGTVRLLEACTNFGIQRFIYPSSSEVYGNKLPNQPMDETHPLNPVTPYAASKLAGEKIALSFFYTKRLPVTVVRFFNVYGPYQNPIKMIPKFILKLLRDEPIFLSHLGKPKRDWIYITDVLEALDKIIAAPNNKIDGEIFNIGTGVPTDIEKIALTILQLLGKEDRKGQLIKYAADTPPETMENVGISQKAKKILGWSAKTSITDGIKKTVEWYKRYYYEA